MVTLKIYHCIAIPAGPYVTAPPGSAAPGDSLNISCGVYGALPQPTLTWWVEQLYKYLVAWRNVEKYRHGSLNVLKAIISLATKICYEGMSTNPLWASSPPPRRRGRQGFRLPWPRSPTTPPREPWTPPSPSPSPCSLNTSM